MPDYNAGYKGLLSVLAKGENQLKQGLSQAKARHKPICILHSM